MELPSVLHPKQIQINGFTFQVVSYAALTDEQALKAIILFCRTHKLKKADKKKVIRVITSFDQDSAKLL